MPAYATNHTSSHEPNQRIANSGCPESRASKSSSLKKYRNPRITVTSADQRNQAMARDISTGYTFTRTPASSRLIEGMATKLKKYSKPIQVIPNMKCSQRTAINSLELASPRKLRCGLHAGNVSVATDSIIGHLRSAPKTIYRPRIGSQ